MTNRQIISFNKKFANGEQNIEFSPEGKIVKIENQYYWQQTAIYNKIVELVEYTGIWKKNDISPVNKWVVGKDYLGD